MLDIEHENLVNGVEIGNVVIRMIIGSAWVQRLGQENIVIARRADDGTTVFLETTLVGRDVDGRFIFEAFSPQGLSVISLVALAPPAG